MQYRTVRCVAHDINAICTADENLKPIDRRPCNQSCGEWKVSQWSSEVSYFLLSIAVTEKKQVVSRR